jgi:hypothetical protein
LPPRFASKVLAATATLAEDHTLRLTPFPLDAWKEFPGLFAAAL